MVKVKMFESKINKMISHFLKLKQKLQTFISFCEMLNKILT